MHGHTGHLFNGIVKQVLFDYSLVHPIHNLSETLKNERILKSILFEVLKFVTMIIICRIVSNHRVALSIPQYHTICIDSYKTTLQCAKLTT